MQRNNNSITWNPGELIYEIGSIPEEAYLIVEGYVNIETQDQFKLNTLGKGEVFGESSLLLGTKRTDTARADKQKVVANIIPYDYFNDFIYFLCIVFNIFLIRKSNENPL